MSLEWLLGAVGMTVFTLVLIAARLSLGGDQES
jgi:hypothetical protein